MPNEIYETLLDGNTLAGRLSVSRATIDRWVSRRIIPCYAMGNRCIRFDFQEVRQALTKFGRPALRRLPRGNYCRRRRIRSRFEAVQMELTLCDNPDQLLLSIAVAEEVISKGAAGD
jgi:excisionase family DNA binding protein